jgi:hypothetical protein
MDLAVDLASSRRLLIRILLDQGGFELMVGVCRGVSRGLMLRLMDAHTCKVEIYRPPSLSWRKGLSRCLDAVLPVEAVESGFCWKFELGVRVGIIQQHFSRDLGISEHLIKLRPFSKHFFRLSTFFRSSSRGSLRGKCRTSSLMRAVPLYFSRPSAASLSSRSANLAGGIWRVSIHEL